MLSLLLAMALAQGSASPIPTDAATLRAEIQAADTAFFTLFFERCDPAALSEMVAPDFEMYHDREGVVARDGKSFVARYAQGCAARSRPDAWRSRRALVEDSLNVEPVPGFGAIEEGEHLFYEHKGDGPERLVGRARFVQLWQKDGQGPWRLARVLSLSHRAVD
ncbi:hypothetical protein SLG_04670 [Sphingobium sp. SYK-6]|uniref:nuclear transport factor 2 family protein n=1 Tax=Sphingobium sp. (strain NBRC 103272 / SYK-6) TaxID=627192 RepID=UPI000227673B|nr:nuclear transport factor 2 family protein [Sphingobium sp. SYK-6]BAK65142.1 hypothetical protein SLG_04670 [Sphingobium sp. SYK-6]